MSNIIFRENLRFLAERTFTGSRKLQFHGTSSYFLKGILSQGLKADPLDKTWDSSQKNDSYKPSLESYRGAYFTPYMNKALSSARQTIKKFKGNRLLVCAMIEEKTAYPDEDSFLPAISRAFRDSLGGYTPDSPVIIGGIYSGDFNIPRNTLLKSFREGLIKTYNTDPRNIPMDKTEDLFNSYLDRLLFYEKENVLRYFPNIQFNLSQSEVESNYRNSVENISRNLRGREENPYSSRVFEDVNYKGSNKIICILEFVTEYPEQPKIEVRYGTVTPQIISEYQKAIGTWPN